MSVQHSDVAAFRTWCVSQGFPTFAVPHRGASFDCFVLPQTLCAELPQFAVQKVVTGFTELDLQQRPNEIAVFGVADTVDERMREHVVRHEMFEYIDGCTCMQASAKEIEHLIVSGVFKDEGLRRKYLADRFELFQSLLPYAKDHPEDYSAEKQLEFWQSYFFFKLMQPVPSS